MNQVLTLSATGTTVRFFFVRKHRARHDNIELAHKEAMAYVQSKFEEARKLYPDLKVVDSIPSPLHKEVLIHGYKSLGYECLNVIGD